VDNRAVTSTYIGQVERDPEGVLWALLYHRDKIIIRERMRTLRKAKRRVTDLVLGAADSFAVEQRRPVQTHLNRLVEPRTPTPRRRRTSVATVA
jgi:hypothetical protein